MDSNYVAHGFLRTPYPLLVSLGLSCRPSYPAGRLSADGRPALRDRQRETAYFFRHVRRSRTEGFVLGEPEMAKTLPDDCMQKASGACYRAVEN